jgi:hypothetical protein
MATVSLKELKAKKARATKISEEASGVEMIGAVSKYSEIDTSYFARDGSAFDARKVEVVIDPIEYLRSMITLFGEMDRLVVRETFDPKEMAKVLMRHRTRLGESEKGEKFDRALVMGIVVCLKMGTKQLKKKIGESLVLKLEREFNEALEGCVYKDVPVTFLAEGRDIKSRKSSDLSVSRLIASFPRIATYAMYGAKYFGPVGNNFVKSPNSSILIPQRFAVEHLEAVETFYSMIIKDGSNPSIVVLKVLMCTEVVEEEFRAAFELQGPRCSPSLFTHCKKISDMIKAVKDDDAEQGTSQEIYSMPGEVNFKGIHMELGGTLKEVVDKGFSRRSSVSEDEEADVKEVTAKEIEADEGGILALIGADKVVLQEEKLYFIVRSDLCTLDLGEVDDTTSASLKVVPTEELSDTEIWNLLSERVEG